MENNSLGRVVAETWREQMETAVNIRKDESGRDAKSFSGDPADEWHAGGSKSRPRDPRVNLVCEGLEERSARSCSDWRQYLAASAS